MKMSSSQLHSIASRWAAAWGGTNATDWVALYVPDAIYTDHAFQIHRTGASLLQRHWEIWRNSIPDFVMEIERFDVLRSSEEAGWDGRNPMTFSIRTVNRGSFLRDLPSKKASGKKFVFRGVVDFQVGDDGLIKTVEEWYTWDFGEGRDVKSYHSLPMLGE